MKTRRKTAIRGTLFVLGVAFYAAAAADVVGMFCDCEPTGYPWTPILLWTVGQGLFWIRRRFFPLDETDAEE